MKFLSKNASHILWAAVVVFIFLLLKCQSDKKSERLKQIQAEAAQLQIKHKQDSTDSAYFKAIARKVNPIIILWHPFKVALYTNWITS